ncbi:MAG: DUF4367 domain-containing protein, partial [Clostridiales bacterium]|nr:DUF4367 domain-containing protein [Clostridiales bacterium]
LYNYNIKKIIMEIFSNHIEIHNTQTSSENELDFAPIKLNAIPEGYKAVYEDTDFHSYNIYFENEKKDWLDYTQLSANTDDIFITYDDENGYNRTLTINGMDLNSISDGNNNTILFETDKYIFIFMSNMPEESIVEFIEKSDFSSNTIDQR